MSLMINLYHLFKQKKEKEPFNQNARKETTCLCFTSSDQSEIHNVSIQILVLDKGILIVSRRDVIEILAREILILKMKISPKWCEIDFL